MAVNPVQLLKKYFRKKRELKFFKESSNEEIFTSIFESNKWGDSDSRSGKGSSLDRTVEIREQLPDLLKQLDISSMLDIPCGDFFWMKELELPLQQYIGADIVASLVQQNAQQYGNETISFLQLDLLQDSLPKTDAILCRDCLVHLCFEDIMQAIRNIKASGCAYLLTTNFPELGNNKDIVTGKYRSLNMQCSPFSWPEPLLEIVENKASEKRAKKCLSVWKVSELP